MGLFGVKTKQRISNLLTYSPAECPAVASTVTKLCATILTNISVSAANSREHDDDRRHIIIVEGRAIGSTRRQTDTL